MSRARAPRVLDVVTWDDIDLKALFWLSLPNPLKPDVKSRMKM